MKTVAEGPDSLAGGREHAFRDVLNLRSEPRVEENPVAEEFKVQPPIVLCPSLAGF